MVVLFLCCPASAAMRAGDFAATTSSQAQDVPPQPLHMVLKDAPGHVECIVDDGIEVLTSGRRTRAISHHEVGAGHGYLDSNAVRLTVLMPMIGRLDSNAAVRDSAGERFELGGSPTDVVFDGWGCIDATERDLDGGLHVGTPPMTDEADLVPPWSRVQ
jgi:hypothetical protein